MAEGLVIVPCYGAASRILCVSGEIDMATAPQLAAALDACDVLEVRVDLSGVTFIDSSGIAALLRAHRSQLATGHRLFVKGAHGPVSRVLEITGADSVLSFVN